MPATLDKPQAATQDVQSSLGVLFHMQPGDVAQMKSLLPNVTSEDLLLTAESRTATKVVFSVTFCGVFMTKHTLTRTKKGALTWQ